MPEKFNCQTDQVEVQRDLVLAEVKYRKQFIN